MMPPAAVVRLINNTVMYRGARMGSPRRTPKYPAYFTNRENTAATYGPTAAFKITIESPLVVDDSEWFDYASNMFVSTLDIAAKVLRMDYDSVVLVRTKNVLPPGSSFIVMLLVEPNRAKLLRRRR